jgi:LytS/YehU family sensor histidine kinase
VQIDIDQSILQSNYIVPAFLLQPFVENSIIHGINHSQKEKCNLLIRVKEEQEHFSIWIIDNGIGIKASKILNASKLNKSEGMSITLKKLKHFNENKFENDILISQNENKEEGTTVQINLIKKVKP